MTVSLINVPRLNINLEHFMYFYQPSKPNRMPVRFAIVWLWSVLHCDALHWKELTCDSVVIFDESREPRALQGPSLASVDPRL